MAQTHLRTPSPLPGRPQPSGVRARERGDLDEKIERLLPRLLGVVRRHLQYHEALGDLRPREAEPEDLVIEAVARALRERDEAPPGEQQIYRWLLRFAYQVVEEEVKQCRIEHAHVVRSLDDPLVSHDAEHAFDEPARRLIDVLPAPGPLPEDVVIREEFQEYMQRQLNRLPRGPALALLYHDVEGLTYREVGELFHVSEADARRWVRLARARLAEALTRDGWVNIPPPASLFRGTKAPSRETRREWMGRAGERAGERTERPAAAA
jgi:RNA polymerase sigma factor (sigma-70 family)